MEGTLKRYKNIISGYKPCYVKLVPDQCSLLIARSSNSKIKPDAKLLLNGKVDRVNLRHATVHKSDKNSAGLIPE